MRNRVPFPFLRFFWAKRPTKTRRKGKAHLPLDRIIQKISTLRFQGKPNEVRGLIEEIEKRAPQSIRVRRLRAQNLIDLGLDDEAEKVLLQILKNNPIDFRAIKLLKLIGRDVSFSPETAKAYVEADARDFNRYVIASQHLNQGSFYETALFYARRGLEINGADGDFRLHFEMAKALEMLGAYAAASAAYGLLDDKQAKRGQARCLCQTGMLNQAAKLLRESDVFEKELIPILYALGDIEGAHRYYRTRLTSRLIADAFMQAARPEDISIRAANGQTSGMLIAEGGPGDEIRMAAFYDEVGAHLHDPKVTCDPRLHSLLTRSFPSIRFHPVQRFRTQDRPHLLDERNLVDTRLRTCLNNEALRIGRETPLVCSVLDALGEFRGRREDFDRVPHLIPDQRLVQEWRVRVGLASRASRPKIGIAWRSILMSPSRDVHYFQVSDLVSLRELDADYWILQANATDQELGELRKFIRIRVPEGLDLINDFEGLAALMVALDVVVSPLTNIAELAGSLGVATFILSPDWTTKWRRNGDGSDVWYRGGRVICGHPGEKREEMVRALVGELATRFGSDCLEASDDRPAVDVGN